MIAGWRRRWLARLRFAKGRPTTVPKVIWASPDAARVSGLECPNCGGLSAKPAVLAVDFTPPDRARQVWSLVACPDCTCRFYRDQGLADYGAGEMLSRGRGALYLQQGAGLAQLFRPIARLGLPAGSRLLDIGCGFGFGLDFAVRACGCSGQGMDPAQIAAWGRDRLGLQIEQRFLSRHEPTLHGMFDVVMAAETLEHVPKPPEFLQLLLACLTPGGVLVLTTPDAEALLPTTPAGQLVGLLSPELHIVLQSEASLRLLLRQAGFDHVDIAHDGGALVATAGRLPLHLADPSAFPQVYLDHLERRAADFVGDDDLFWGFAGRCFTEAVNAGDLDRADRVLPWLSRAARQRFGVDLDRPVLPEETRLCALQRMAELLPLNLGAILLADAMRRLAAGAMRASQQQRLLLAAEAARRLARATGELAMAEPMSDEIAWVAEAEALLCAVEDPATPDLDARLRSLPPAPGGDASRPAGVMRRAFVLLVNAGRYQAAARLLETAALTGTDAQLGRDAAFCRAVLALQPGGDAWQARRGFAWVRAGLAPPHPVDSLFWAALRGEVLACDSLSRPGDADALLMEVAAGMAEGMALPAEFAVRLSNRTETSC